MDTFIESPITRLDGRGRLLACNAAYSEMTGLSESALIGKSLEDCHASDMPKAIWDELWRTIAAGSPWVGPVRVRQRNGDTGCRILYLMPLFDEGRLSALGTVYFEMDEASSALTERYYARLTGNTWSLRWPRLVQRLLRLQALPLGGACICGAGLALAGLATWPATLVWLGMTAQALHTGRTYGKLTGQWLAGHTAIYHSPLLQPLYANEPVSASVRMALESLQWRLRTVVARLGINAQQLRHQAQQSAQLSQATAVAMNEQQRLTDLAATAIDQMSVTIGTLSHKLKASASAASDAERLALEAEKLSKCSESSMEELGEAVMNAGMATADLVRSVETIDSVAQVIQSIAEQTNLLALNAAIEAARAGDSGRGFAVVAAEVRSLASRTATCTQEIQTTLTGLRGEAEHAKVLAGVGRKNALQVKEDVGQARDAMNAICTQVRQISNNSHHMAAAIEQQGTVAADIASQITAIAQRTETHRNQSDAQQQIAGALHRLAESQLALASRFVGG